MGNTNKQKSAGYIESKVLRELMQQKSMVHDGVYERILRVCLA